MQNPGYHNLRILMLVILLRRYTDINRSKLVLEFGKIELN